MRQIALFVVIWLLIMSPALLLSPRLSFWQVFALGFVFGMLAQAVAKKVVFG